MSGRGEPNYEYLIITYNPVGGKALEIGVLLWDKAQRRLHHSLRKDWAQLIAKEDRELPAGISDDLLKRIADSNDEEVLLYCEDTFSNIFRVSDRIPLPSEGPPETVLTQLEQQLISRSQH